MAPGPDLDQELFIWATRQMARFPGGPRDRHPPRKPGWENFPTAGDQTRPLPFSDGEVHFLYWFIQGSIMNPETRCRLRRAWGFCQRHALAHLAVEFAFRNGWVHGCAVLYDDIMDRARLAFGGPIRPRLWLALRLRQTAPCLMCELGFGPDSAATAPADILSRGREAAGLQAFGLITEPYWRPAVCAHCLGQTATPQSPRCRPHLVADILARRPVDLPAQKELVASVCRVVSCYSRSFRLEFQGTDTVEDRAGLIAAVGWCSGWSEWLRLVGVR